MVDRQSPWGCRMLCSCRGDPAGSEEHNEVLDESFCWGGVQVVEHTARGVAYPVVADPTYWWGGKTWVPANKVSVGQTASILYALIPGFAGPVALYNVGLGLCNQGGKGIWVYWTWAGHIWCTGP